MFSLNYDQTFDSGQESPHFNSSITNDCDITFTCDYLECNDNTIQTEDSEDSEKTIQEESLVDGQCVSSLNDSVELPEILAGVESMYEKICQMKHSTEKSVDPGISMSNINIEDNNKIAQQVTDDCIDIRDTVNSSNIVKCKNIEGNVRIKGTKLQQNVTMYINDIEDPLQEVEVGNTVTSTIEFSNAYTNNSGNYLLEDVSLLKYPLENAKYTSSVANIEINMKETVEKIEEMVSENSPDSAEEQMLEASFAVKAENDHDDVMRKIIESCTNISIDFYRSACESSNVNLGKLDSEYVTEKFRRDELFPHRLIVSETAIAKKDIQKTIEEAKKILTDSLDTGRDIKNRSDENCDEGNSLGKCAEKAKNNEEYETIDRKEDDFHENGNIKANPQNMKIEEAVISQSDIIESNLQKLTEIACPGPKTHVEISETLKKIADEKRRIEDRKKESLETLSKKFDEIEKFIVDCDNVSYISNNDRCGLRNPDDLAGDSDSHDELQVDPDDLEMPLTKSEITENLKIEELKKELASEMEEHRKLMDEYQGIIAMDLECAQHVTSKSKSTRICADDDIDEESKNVSTDNEQIGDRPSSEASEMRGDTRLIKIDSESDDSLSGDSLKTPEKICIKGKVYDFDEKMHGVR